MADILNTLTNQVLTHISKLIGNLKTYVDNKGTNLKAHTDTEVANLKDYTDTEIANLKTHADTEVGDLRTHTDTELGDLRTHTDTELSDLRTYAEVEFAKLNQNALTGSKGEILFHSGTAVFTQSLLNEGMVTTSTEEYNTCINKAPSFKEVFETWKPFSHLNGKQNANANDLKGWYYDATRDTIVEKENSESYTGYVSPKTFSNFDVTVRCYSTNSDDDTLGLVGAFAVDANGVEHTLSFLATPYANGSTARWLCKVDHCVFDPITTSNYNQIILANKSSAITTGGSVKNWKGLPTGITIHMTRDGNKFTATCSQFNSTTLDNNTTMTIDLDALSDTYPVLNNFKGSASWGYSSFSQPDSCYENISITNADGYIYDLATNKVMQYNAKSGKWEAIAGAKVTDTIGAGRLSFNKVTGKLFFCNGNEVIHIASV